MEKIQWAPKVSRSKIWRLYQNDARGAIDEALVEDVGWALLLRCRSILHVSRREVECPRCGTVILLSPTGSSDVVGCPTPGCDWATTTAVWHASWRHQDLIGSNALPVFATFVDRYPVARSVRERTFLIDQLIHAFHWDARQQLPNRSVGNNLIVGSHATVVAFLDGLSHGDINGFGTEAEKTQWRATVQTMWRRRRAAR